MVRSLRIDLDWVQYKANFREPVMVRRVTDAHGKELPLAEIAIDLRQVDAARLPVEFARAMRCLDDAGAESNVHNHLYLDEFRPYRDCLIWTFNGLFWRHVADWEKASGRRFDASLPGGSSDANHPQAISDSAAEFWTLLRDLETRGQLPAEIVGLEIAVGSGRRAASWLDCFKALDEQRGTTFYSRLHFILGDVSPTSLERAVAAVAHHGHHVSGVPLDAMNPCEALTAHRSGIMHVHLNNLYDNLPFDCLARRDGAWHIVEVRAYLNGPLVDRLSADFGISRADLPGKVNTLLEGGPNAVFEGEKGVTFWRRLWDAFKLEERLRALDDGEDDHVPPVVSRRHFEDLLAEVPDDVRFHVSRGASESFANTLPLLHPHGFLQVQDIFVSEMDDYRNGFRGPGKLDGSLVTWVNGALLRAVGARAGYDVHFAPFPHRSGAKTSILSATRRHEASGYGLRGDILPASPH